MYYAGNNFIFAIIQARECGTNCIVGDTTAVCFQASPLIWNVVGLIQNVEHERM
ncbi:hypothetical protein ACQKP0_15970 [Heyndrickxia sp. NPDC080065]|uniref:hypothetical protein n=1 Tax=Heyndrickxia sp. NPDC080065 TaxID=3390568 RepID=UPI003CFE5784